MPFACEIRVAQGFVVAIQVSVCIPLGGFFSNHRHGFLQILFLCEICTANDLHVNFKLSQYHEAAAADLKPQHANRSSILGVVQS